MEKYESNEKIWREKYDRKAQECTQVLKLHETLKEDNNDALV